MSDDINQIERGYDLIAEEYACHIFEELQHKPLDRELLDRFAASVKDSGKVCDLGCGPGHIARHLRDAGLSVFGIDLSPAMLAQAQRLCPDISFRQGNMLLLDLPDEALAGIAAFYAIVNLPKQTLPVAFHEMSRVLRPGGCLLLSFHIGDETVHVEELWGQQTSLDFFLFPLMKSGICSNLQAFSWRK